MIRKGGHRSRLDAILIDTCFPHFIFIPKYLNIYIECLLCEAWAETESNQSI